MTNSFCRCLATVMAHAVITLLITSRDGIKLIYNVMWLGALCRHPPIMVDCDVKRRV